MGSRGQENPESSQEDWGARYGRRQAKCLDKPAKFGILYQNVRLYRHVAVSI